MHFKFYSISEIGVGDIFNQMRSEQAVSSQRPKKIAEESGELVDLLRRRQPPGEAQESRGALGNCSSLRIWRGFTVKSTHCIVVQYNLTQYGVHSAPGVLSSLYLA